MQDKRRPVNIKYSPPIKIKVGNKSKPRDTEESKEVFNQAEAATFLGISVPSLRKATREGTIPSLKIGRSIRYSKATLLKIFDSSSEVLQLISCPDKIKIVE